MNSFLMESSFVWLAISLLGYAFGELIKRKLKLAIFNPLLISIVCVIIVLKVFHIDYENYKQGASLLSYLLTPATVCLAIPLYEQIHMLRSNYKAILLGIFSGVLTSLASVTVVCMCFKVPKELYVSVLPKSITTAIGLGIAEELGGITTITVAIIVLTGIFGFMFSEMICKMCGIKNPVAVGIAIGTASHAMGTAKALEIGEVEGAMSSLSIAVAGLMTVIGASLIYQIYPC